jgi:hypothetical protein
MAAGMIRESVRRDFMDIGAKTLKHFTWDTGEIINRISCFADAMFAAWEKEAEHERSS